jgi:methylmalonyl-CoA/ethylmalonyl-CoA epimerase
MNFFGVSATLEHIGLVVESIKAIYPQAVIEEDPIQNVLIAFMEINGVETELLEPLSDESPVYKSLRDGKKILHLCFEVDSLEQSIKYSKQFSFHQISPITPAAVFGGRKIVWVYHKVLGLFELLERT